MRSYIITGKVHSGKTTFSQSLCDLMVKDGYKTGGFLSIGYFNNNERSSFDILSLLTGEKMELAVRKDFIDSPYYFGSYLFNKEAVLFGEDTYKKSVENGCDFIFLDECGMYELKKGGFYNILTNLNNCNSIIIAVVRENFADMIDKEFFNSSSIVLDIEKYTVQEAYQVIKNGNNSL